MKFKSWLLEDIKSFVSDSISKDTIKSVLRGVVDGCIQNVMKCKPLFEDKLQENYLQDLWDTEGFDKQESIKLFDKYIGTNPALLSQMESLFGIQRDGLKIYHGGEGIVYPFKGKDPDDLQMVKFIIAQGGGAEFKIANGMKGHRLAPVLHTFKIVHRNFNQHEVVIYGFITKRLISTGLDSLIHNIEEIATEFESIIDDFETEVKGKTLSWRAIPYEEPADASKIQIGKEDIQNLFKNIKEHFMDKPVKDQKVAKEILAIIETIYKKTGFIFGRDFTGGFGSVSNIGLTAKAKIQPYDFGLSIAVSKKATEAATGFPTIELR